MTPRWRREQLGSIAVVAVALALQWVMATAGTGTLLLPDARTTSTLYRAQADGFAAGTWALPQTPPDALLALPDPYDPAARVGVCAMHDVSFRDGRYSLYFGPAPAVVMLLLDPLVGGRLLDDRALVVVFVAGMTIAAFGVIERVRRLVAPGSPWWIGAMGGAVVAFANPTLFLLARPAVYEAAIAAGQCFLLCGAYCALRAIDARRAWPWWALAGAAVGLVCAARASLLPAALLVIGAAVIWTARRRAWSSLAAFVGPPIVIGGVIGWLNLIRFGSPLEFGQRYQLTNLNLHRDYATFFSLDYLPRNLSAFFARPFALDPVFPFVGWLPLDSRTAAWASTTAPVLEPIIGLLWTTPFVALGVGVLVGWRSRRWPLLVLGLAVAVAAALPVLLQRWITMRYLADFAPLLAILGATGAMLLWQSAASARRGARAWRLVVSASVMVAGGVSILLGLLLGTRGYEDHFARNNPALFAMLGGAPLPERATDLRVTIGGAELVAYRFEPPTVGPGEETTLALTWRLGAPTDAVAHLRVVTMDFQPVASASVAVPSGDGVVEQRVPLRLAADTPPGYLEVEMQAQSASGAPVPMRTRAGEPIAAFTLRPIRVPWRGAWPPDGFIATDVRFGESMRLAGARVERDDDTVLVSLAWTAGRLDDERLVTLTLVDSAGRMVATKTGAPGGGRLMTRLWRPDETLVDDWELPAPRDLPPGAYRLIVQVSACAGPVRPRGDPVIGPFAVQ